MYISSQLPALHTNETRTETFHETEAETSRFLRFHELDHRSGEEAENQCDCQTTFSCTLDLEPECACHVLPAESTLLRRYKVSQSNSNSCSQHGIAPGLCLLKYVIIESFSTFKNTIQRLRIQLSCQIV